MARRYWVSADVKYLDGPLAGLVIPAGQRVSYPSKKLADRRARFLASVRDADDFTRAALTGHRYKVIGPIDVNRVG